MYNYQNHFFLLLTFILCTAFSIVQEKEPVVINLVDPIVEQIPMSRLFLDVKLVHLNTSSEDTINKRANYYLSDKYIFVTNVFDKVLVFDRHTGQFDKQISQQGIGIDEYSRMPVFSYGYDEEDDIFFFDDNKQWKAIDIKTNKTIKTITKPKERRDITLLNIESQSIQSSSTISSKSNNDTEKGWKQGTIFNPWSLGNGKYAGFVNNSTGNVDVGLIVFDETGAVLKSFPNSRKYLKSSVGSRVNPGQFYNYNEQTYFKEMFYNDTVFLVNDTRLIPHIIFNTGDRNLPYEELSYEVNLSNNDKFRITFVQETDSYIFFNYLLYSESYRKDILFSGYYEKETSKTYVCESKNGHGGFVDDLNGLFSFNPLYINNKEELIGVLPAKIIEQFKEEPNLSEYVKSLLMSLNDNKSPIVIIAKLKTNAY